MSLYLGSNKISGIGANGKDGTILTKSNVTSDVASNGCGLILSSTNKKILCAYFIDGHNGYIIPYKSGTSWYGKFKNYEDTNISGSCTITIITME